MIFSQTQKDQIRLWRSKGFSYTFIAHSLGKRYGEVKKFCEKEKIVKTVSTTKQGKDDHLFLEPVAQGKMYKNYVLHK